MSTTTYFGSAEAQVARSLIGGTAIGDTRNELLKQVLVAVANKTSGGGGAAWGAITGTLSNQTDLANALAAKLSLAGGTMTGDLTTKAAGLLIPGSVSGTVTVQAPAVAGTPTITLPSVTSTLATLGANGFTGQQILSANGAASTPALQLTGAPFTGGSATTTKPLALIETSGATSSSWSTNGTMLGINSPSGFSGTALSIQKNGVESVNIRHDGWIVSQFGIGANSYYNSGGGLVLTFQTIAADTLSASIAGNLSIKNSAALIVQGTATPEAAITAPPGSTYHRNNSGTGELWLKTSGTGNTGWTKIL